MTGLDVAESRQEYLDEVEDRYHMVISDCYQLLTACYCDNMRKQFNQDCLAAELCVAHPCRLLLVALNLPSRKLAFPLLSGQIQSISTDHGPSTFMSSKSQQMALIGAFCLRSEELSYANATV